MDETPRIYPEYVFNKKEFVLWGVVPTAILFVIHLMMFDSWTPLGFFTTFWPIITGYGFGCLCAEEKEKK